jgi:dsRNA-specific ribonuclease
VSSFKVIDSKTRLQEYLLKKFKALPIYKLISNTGPRHKPNFPMSVKIKDSKTVIADGSSKKNAEQAAAMKLLETIKI